RQVTESIEAHLTDEQFGVEPLAEMVEMSTTHLNRKLKALIGQKAGKLIRSMRLQRAADLIAQEAGNISDIAYQYCFSDPTNFARAFKVQFGVAPSQYRGQMTGDSAPHSD
ncbi:MAG: AraC family transcriptional regulator, partial [Bacteroidetes bacterium]